MSLLRKFIVVIVLTQLSGCSQLAYYGQSVIGHSKLMLAREPLESSIDNAREAQDHELAELLEQAQLMREFAVRELSLPNNRSYATFVPLKRGFPVWTVVATSEFSVEPKQWCYLVIGCASYRGYFSLKSARKYATKLNNQGLETVLGGASAYSTLGWFADPLLPSMMRHGEGELADTLFHELAHQVLYVNNNSRFNEAFATVVGEYGAQRWLEQRPVQIKEEYLSRRAAYHDFVQLLLTTRARLAELYSQPFAPAVMREQKQAEFEQLKRDYNLLKQSRWAGRAWFDNWFEAPLNNARLSAVATYRDEVRPLAALLAQCNHQLNKFYTRLKLAAKQKPLVIPDAC